MWGNMILSVAIEDGILILKKIYFLPNSIEYTGSVLDNTSRDIYNVYIFILHVKVTWFLIIHLAYSFLSSYSFKKAKLNKSDNRTDEHIMIVLLILKKAKQKFDVFLKIYIIRILNVYFSCVTLYLRYIGITMSKTNSK